MKWVLYCITTGSVLVAANNYFITIISIMIYYENLFQYKFNYGNISYYVDSFT